MLNLKMAKKEFESFKSNLKTIPSNLNDSIQCEDVLIEEVTEGSITVENNTIILPSPTGRTLKCIIHLSPDKIYYYKKS